MFILLPLAVIIILAVLAKKRQLGLLRNRYYIILGVISALWWLFLIIDQLRLHLSCTPDDELCNSGNTFWGDVVWGSILAIFSLSLVWVPALLIGIYLQKKTHSSAKKKK